MQVFRQFFYIYNVQSFDEHNHDDTYINYTMGQTLLAESVAENQEN